MPFTSRRWNVCILVSPRSVDDNMADMLQWVKENIDEDDYHIENADMTIPFDGKSYAQVHLHLEHEEDINLVKLIFAHRYVFDEIYRRRPC